MAKSNIPNYALYGDANQNLFPDILHIEAIRTRSKTTGWKFRPHRHYNLYQFFYIDQGGGHCQIDGREYEISDKLLIVIPPVFIHGFSFSNNTKGWVLSISDIQIRSLFEQEPELLDLISAPHYIHKQSQDWHDTIKNHYVCLMQDAKTPSNLQSFLLRSHTQALLGQILSVAPRPNKGNMQTPALKIRHVQSFQASLEDDFRQRKTVAQYAELLGISPTHLNRICKSELNMSASQVIDNRTVLEAKRFLIYTSQTSSEISYILGFCDPAHFSKFFHNKIGKTPSLFRKSYLART